MEGLTEKVAFEDDLKAMWQESTAGERNSKCKDPSMPDVSKEKPVGQCGWSRENKSMKGRGEFRQVIRSWVTWGLEGQGKEA